MRGVPNVSDPDSQLFAALADQERRLLLERLAEGPAPVHVLAAATRISRSAASQHLWVLRRAGLVRSERRGREIVYFRMDEGLTSAREWLTRFRQKQLGRLAPTGEVPLHNWVSLCSFRGHLDRRIAADESTGRVVSTLEGPWRRL